MSTLPPSKSSWLKPWTLIAGFVLGMIALAFAGRAVTKKDWHTNFTRFHPMIAPDSLYEPTVAEISAIVRARCSKEQILVIVGGNSVLLGVGQPADKMWTLRLQQLLGSRYAVVNLAFRGSTPTDGGAVVAEALREEFSRQIYVANVAPFQGLAPAGIDTYRFILFDAYYKDLLLPWEPRNKAIGEVYDRMKDSSRVLEIKTAQRVDALLHYRSFWNWVTFTKRTLFPSPLSPKYPDVFRARGEFKDAEPDYEATPVGARFPASGLEAEMHITSRYTEQYYTKDEAGKWRATDVVDNVFKASIRTGFPDSLKPRTLMLVGRNNPYYTARLPAEIRERDDIAYAQCVEGWEAEGYSAAEFGKNFTPEDYGDRSHLTNSGGRKLAEIAAAKIKTMSQKLGYLKP